MPGKGIVGNFVNVLTPLLILHVANARSSMAAYCIYRWRIARSTTAALWPAGLQGLDVERADYGPGDSKPRPHLLARTTRASAIRFLSGLVEVAADNAAPIRRHAGPSSPSCGPRRWPCHHHDRVEQNTARIPAQYHNPRGRARSGASGPPRPHPTDRRATNVELTERGAVLCKDLWTQHLDGAGKVFSVITERRAESPAVDPDPASRLAHRQGHRLTAAPYAVAADSGNSRNRRTGESSSGNVARTRSAAAGEDGGPKPDRRPDPRTGDGADKVATELDNMEGSVHAALPLVGGDDLPRRPRVISNSVQKKSIDCWKRRIATAKSVAEVANVTSD